MNDLALGLDLGTTGVRSAVVEPDGRVVGVARVAYTAGNTARIDAEGWWTAATACIEAQVAALSDHGIDHRRIGRLAVDGTSGSLVLTDAALRPVTRALMYDAAGFEAEAEVIARHAPNPHIARGPASALARALRLQAEDTSCAAVHLLHQADFIAARLMGRGGLSDANNALKTGYDPGLDSWPDWIAATGLRTALLPTVSPPGTPLHPLDAGVADTLGLSRAATVHAGTTDSIAAFLAAAPLEMGTAVTSLGTTLAIKMLSPTRIDAPEMGLYAHRLGPGWLVGGASNSGGGVLRAHFDDAALARLSAQIDPGKESPLDYYPLPRPGERFPFNDPAWPPRLTPRPPDDAAFLHGLLEGIARIERQGYAELTARGAPWPTRVLTAGGGARSEVWTAIRSRVLGVAVLAAPEAEAAVGSARLCFAER